MSSFEDFIKTWRGGYLVETDNDHSNAQYAAALAAWRAAKPKWLPIESAPMGKRVLVKRFGHEPEIRRIVKDIEGDIVAIRDCGMRVLISVFDAYMELPKQIIQWVPLPEPPASKKK